MSLNETCTRWKTASKRHQSSSEISAKETSFRLEDDLLGKHTAKLETELDLLSELHSLMDEVWHTNNVLKTQGSSEDRLRPSKKASDNQQHKVEESIDDTSANECSLQSKMDQHERKQDRETEPYPGKGR